MNHSEATQTVLMAPHAVHGPVLTLRSLCCDLAPHGGGGMVHDIGRIFNHSFEAFRSKIYRVLSTLPWRSPHKGHPTIPALLGGRHVGQGRGRTHHSRGEGRVRGGSSARCGGQWIWQAASGLGHFPFCHTPTHTNVQKPHLNNAPQVECHVAASRTHAHTSNLPELPVGRGVCGRLALTSRCLF